MDASRQVCAPWPALSVSPALKASRSAVIQNAEYFDLSSSGDEGDARLAGRSRARKSVLLLSRVKSEQPLAWGHSSLNGSGEDLVELEEGEIDESGIEEAGQGFFIDRRKSGNGQDVGIVASAVPVAIPDRSPAHAGFVMSTLGLAAAADWRAPDPVGHLPSAALAADLSRLHHQLLALATSASPTPAQRERTAAALIRVEASVKRALPGCRVTLFGSNANNLALPDSDLDLVAVTAAHAAATASAAAAELRQRMEHELAGRRAAPNGRKRRRDAAVASGAVGGGLSVAARKEAIKPLRMVMRQIVRDGVASRDVSQRPEVIKAKVPIVKFVEV
jgi:predicted nucleotidyltransferase